MSALITLDWSDFKSYLGQSLVPFKQITRNNSYYLYLSDGALTATCTIPKDGGSDQTDYEASYQSRANKNPFVYSVGISIRQTAATAAGKTVFAMRNAAASTRTIVIERIMLNMSFDSGTPLGRSTQSYGIQGFNTATPTGGSTISAAPFDNTAPATQVTDIRYVDTGLTTTSVNFGNTLGYIICPATDATTSQFIHQTPNPILAPGEGLCIRLGVAAVVGQALGGMITWSER